MITMVLVTSVCAPVPGCLDPLADNYDPNATVVDDGSCSLRR